MVTMMMLLDNFEVQSTNGTPHTLASVLLVEAFVTIYESFVQSVALVIRLDKQPCICFTKCKENLIVTLQKKHAMIIFL